MTKKCTITLALAVLLLIFTAVLDANGQEEKESIEFEHLSVEHGLSQSTVFCILQDDLGFLWFGTQHGLNRYDGHNFKWYVRDPKKNSISNNLVISLFQTEDKAMWIGTWGGGLNRFDRNTGKFEHFESDPKTSTSINDNNVWVIHQDNDNKDILWLGTENGISKFRIKEKKCERRYLYEKKLSDKSNAIRVNEIIHDKNGIMWVGTDNGLYEYDRQKDDFIQHLEETENHLLRRVKAICEVEEGELWLGTESGLCKYSQRTGKLNGCPGRESPVGGLGELNIREIYKENSKRLWIGTQGKGIFIYNFKIKETKGFQNDPSKPGGLSHNYTRSIYKDKTGIIWIGTNGGGVNKFDPKKKKFVLYRSIRNDQNSLSHNDVMAFFEFENKPGEIWIATRGGGINRFELKTNSFKHYSIEDDNISQSPRRNDTRAICGDHNGEIWVGTERAGLYRFDPESGQFGKVPTSFDISSDEYILCILETKDRSLWIGTMNGGLIKIDNERKSAERIKDGDKGLNDDKIFSIFEDQKGILWVGTGDGGLNRYENDTFSHYKADVKEPNSISSNFILSIYEAKDGTLWIGTNGGGLNRFDRKKTFKAFTTIDGLPNDVIYDIQEDKSGNLWLSTNKGLCRFKQGTQKVGIRNFTIRDGLQSYEFNRGAALKAQSDLMFFGGVNGFNTFNPADIKDTSKPPPIVITELKKLEKDYPLNTFISETKQLKLSYTDTFISFEFAVLDFTDPASNRYEYKLEPDDKGWVKLGDKHDLTIPKFEAGEYSLRIRGCNNENNWNETGTPLEIIVSPPLYKEPWFLVLAALLGGILIYIYVQYRTRSIEKKKKELMQEVEERKRVEMQLRESEGRYRTLVENSPEAITLCDDNGKIVMTNKQSAVLLGYRDTHELISAVKTIFDLVQKNERPQMRKNLESGETRNFEVTLCAKNGTPIAAETSICMVKEEDDKPKYFLAITRDIRERKEAEKREKMLTQVDKMVSLGTLVSGVAHELNNPSGFIMMNAESFSKVWQEIVPVLDLYHAEDPNFKIAGMPYESCRQRIQELIDGLLDGAHRIKNIIQDLKEYSRPEDSLKIAVDLNKVVNASINLTGSTLRKVTNNVSINLEENLPVLWGSSQKLEQVFINLIQNAGEALTTRDQPIEITTRHNKENNQIEIKVKDGGLGISEER